MGQEDIIIGRPVASSDAPMLIPTEIPVEDVFKSGLKTAQTDADVIPAFHPTVWIAHFASLVGEQYGPLDKVAAVSCA